MKRFVLFFVMCVLGINLMNAQEVAIGLDGGDFSLDYYGPIEEYNKYSISQQIYTEEELGGGMYTITQVSFKLVYCCVETIRNIEIYMINTDKASFESGQDWANVTAADLVYSGEVVYPGPLPGEFGLAWLDITLQKPFTYEGGNLLICCNDLTGVNTKDSGFAQYYPESNRAIFSGGETQYNVSELIFAVGRVIANNQIKFMTKPYTGETETEVPENVVATPVDAHSINLTWDAVAGAVSYDIYRDEEYITSVEETEYLDVDLDASTTYCYNVVSVYEDGTMSDYSEQACAETQDDIIEDLTCEVPANLQAVPESTSAIALTWDASENADGYKIYKDGEFLASVEETSYVAEGLEYNKEYCFAVSAFRGEFESDRTDAVCAKTLGEGVAECYDNIAIYPNPVKDQLFINVNAEINEVCIYNVTGAMVYRSNEIINNVINVAQLANGTYVVKVKTSDTELVKRFVKK